jgi:alcohol dehydrogenase YqhD (iron-dependent ADH family)
MNDYRELSTLIIDDELVNDFEFAVRIYTNRVIEEQQNYYTRNQLMWADADMI